MVKVGEYGIVLDCTIKEGNVTIQESHKIGGNELEPHLSAPVRKGQPVKLAGYDEKYHCPIVELCSAGDKAIGYLFNSPDWREKEPTADASYGEYDSRAASVEFRAKVMQTVQLEASNSKIVVGNYIKEGTTTVGTFDKSTNATCDIALQDATAGSGIKIDVLFGVY